jgi:ABC-type protease/lipase transport system fused ATPase/permease subunit
VFRRINVTIEPGEMLCIMGPSATGKTTLSRLLTGILMPRSGQVRLGDIEIGRLPPELLSGLVGYLQQEVHLFTGTVRENIARMGEGDFEDIVEAARIANIHETIVRLPQGYDTEIADETSALSGGERKRIALARAFYGRPRLIVLDEPEANLDRASLKALIEAMETLKAQGSTIVVTTQSRRLGKIADRVLILGSGSAQVRDSDADKRPSNTDTAATGKSSRRADRIRTVS